MPGSLGRARRPYAGWAFLAIAVVIQAVFCALPTMWISVTLGGLALMLGVWHVHRGLRTRDVIGLIVASAVVTVPLACIAVGLQASLARHRSADLARERSHHLREQRYEPVGAGSDPGSAESVLRPAQLSR